MRARDVSGNSKQAVLAYLQRIDASGYVDSYVNDLAKLIDGAVAAERDACAKIADELSAKRRATEESSGFGPETAKPVANQYWCEEIAAAIRARKNST